MKTSNYLLGSLRFLLMLFFLAACDSDPVDPTNNGDLSGTESVAQEINLNYVGEDLEFVFNNGAILLLKSSENPELPSGEIKIKLIKNENYFNTNQDIVFDFSDIRSSYKFNISYKLKPNLVKEDIVLIQYLTQESKNTMAAKEIQYNYNKNTGEITATFGVSSTNNKKTIFLSDDNYNRLLISWADREELSKADEEQILQLPYYEQAGGTCWATCAAMLSRAYSNPKDSYDSKKIIDFVKYLGHSSLDDGIGLWDFSRNLPKAINLYSSTSTEVSTFVSSTNMLAEIIKKLKEKKPVIANLSYPGVGKHAIVIVGYRRELVSAAKIDMKLLIHNPQNAKDESMYKWVHWDWLIKDKWPQEAWQILYPKDELRTTGLITLGMPIEKHIGELHFRVTSPSMPEKTGYTINLKYSKSDQEGYYWNLNNTKCEILPDTASALEYKLPVYNTGEAQSQVKLKVKLLNTKTGKTLIENTETKNCPKGITNIEGALDLNKLVSDEVIEGELVFELTDAASSKYFDGYRLKIKLKRSKIEFLKSFSFNIMALYDDGSTELSKLFIYDFNLKKSGAEYFGSRERYFKNIYGDSVRGDEKIKIVFDNAINPTKFKEIEVEVLYRNILHDGTFGKQRQEHKVILENVPLVRIRPDVAEWKWWGIKGAELCQYVKKFEYYINGRTTNKFSCSSSAELGVHLN